MPEKIIDVPGFGPTAFPDTMSDDDIVKAIQAQHPDLAPKNAAPAATPPPTGGLLSRFGNVAKTMIANDPAANIIAGFGKDVASTGLSLLQMAKRNNARPGQPPPVFNLPEGKPEILEPQGGMQKVGAGLSTVAQFAAPSAAAGKIPAVAKLGLLGRAGVEAGISGAVSKARGDEDADAIRNAIMSGGITAGLGLIGKAAGPLGRTFEKKLLKPVSADLKAVKGPPEEAADTLIDNLYKHDLGGTLEQSYAKAAAKTKDLGQRLRTIIAANPSAEVDLGQVLADTEAELMKDTAKNFGTNAEVRKALDKMYEEAISISPQTGRVNLADGQDIKQALGLIGSWKNGMRDAESTAMETVANTMYSKMRAAIESASGQSAEVQAINKEFGEIIPIKNALIRRIPVAARSDVIGLKQAIGLAAGGPAGLGLSIADRVIRSGPAANALVKFGKNSPAAGASAARVLTGVTATAADRLRSRANPNP